MECMDCGMNSNMMHNKPLSTCRPVFIIRENTFNTQYFQYAIILDPPVVHRHTLCVSVKKKINVIQRLQKSFPIIYP